MLACSNLVAEPQYAPRHDDDIEINRVYPSFLIRPHDSRFRIRLLGPEKIIGVCADVRLGCSSAYVTAMVLGFVRQQDRASWASSQISTATVMEMCVGCTGVQPKATTGTA